MDISYIFAGGSVALLLTVLVVMSLNRRAKQQRATEQLLRGSMVGEDASFAVVGEDALEPVLAAQPSAPHSAPSHRPMPGADRDPVSALLESLMEGEGPFSQPELRRLELYRPERVIAAADATEAALNGKGKEAKRRRLLQARQYAEAMRNAVAEPVADSSDPQGITPVVAEGLSLVVTQGLTPVLPYGDVEPGFAEPTIPGVAAGSTAEPAETVPPQSSVDEPTVSLDLELAGGTGLGAPIEYLPESEESLVEWASDEDEAWSETAQGDPPEEDTVGEMWERWEAELGQPVEPEPFSEPLVELPLPYESGEGAEREAEGGLPDAGQEVPEESSPGSTGLAALEVRITSAEDVLSLSTDERIDALAFLSPAELGRVFALGGEPELKYAVIDLLESTGSADSLMVLDDILEDPEPEFQLYALDAAERLLQRA
jgi:hypothetical protein